MAGTIQSPFVSRFTPNGLSDALFTQDGDTNAQPGGCLLLQNLVPDRKTRGVYAPRPAYSVGFDASNATAFSITAPGAATFATAPLSGALLTFTDDNTSLTSLGTGNGVTTVFNFTKGGNPYQPVNQVVYMQDWQGNQLQYTTPRTNVAKNNVATTGFGGSTTLTLGTDATAGPDGGVSVFGQEGSSSSAWLIETVKADGSTSVGDYYTIVVDFALTPGYANNENLLILQFQSAGASNTSHIDILNNTVVSTTGSVVASFVASLPNGFSRFSFVVGPATSTVATGPSMLVGLNNSSSFTGDGATKLYVRHDIKKTQTVSSWIKNTTASAISVTDYTMTNTTVGTAVGNISAMTVIGSRAYGMALGNNAGTYFDFPFCYDFSTGAFVAISGITSANTPKSSGYPNGSGSAGSPAVDWVAPQMQLVGSKIMVTHYGFAGTGKFIGWIDISTPSTPSWSAGNLTGALSFSVPPVAVTAFNGRAYYAVGGNANSNNVIFSDSLAPTVATNATQVLTVGDNTPVLGFGQQPYNSTSSGGIIQSILAFKASSQIAQISGDSTTSNLLVNVIASGVGCAAPQTIASTPLGVTFMAADGVRYIDAYGKVSPPLPGVRAPFINCSTLGSQCFPSTACASYNSNMYRISLYTPDSLGNVFRQEFVFDLEYGWHGPHIYDEPTDNGIAVIAPYSSSFLIVRRQNVPATASFNKTTAKISNLLPSPADSFIEGGNTLDWSCLSCVVEDEAPMLAKNLVEGVIAYNPGNVDGDITVSVIPGPVGTDSGSNQPAGVAEVMSYTAPGALWGTAVWGAFQWGGSALKTLSEATIPLEGPVAYKRVQFQVDGTAALNQRLGPLSYRGEIPGQTNLDQT